MTEDKIKTYFGDTTVYKFTKTPNQIVPILIDKGISVNYIVVNDIVYLSSSEPLDNMLDDDLSIFSTSIGV